MAYTTQAQIETAIPAPILTAALDDNRDGSADSGLLTTIIASADQAVDAFLSSRYTVPFTTPPSAVKEASFTFACERIYARRPGASDTNPWKTTADYWRKRLQLYGDGTLALDVATETENPPGVAITSNMSTTTSTL